MAGSAQAVPALRQLRSFAQPDGSTVKLTLCGDEHFHWYADADGRPMTRDDDGWWQVMDDDTFSSLRLLHQQHRRPQVFPREKSLASSISNSFGYYSFSSEQPGGTPWQDGSNNDPAHPQWAGPQRAGTSTQPKGTQRVLVILADFPDQKFSRTDIQSAMKQHLNGENYQGSGFGSARDYFIAQSGGLFTPEFDVYGPYTTTEEMSYYGKNNQDGYDTNPGEMIADVVKKGNSDINYRDYDSDGDGIVEFCYVIYAGYGEAQGADENTIWPHQWSLSAANGSALKLDGVQINAYACSNELKGVSGKTLDGIGTICHEFSHCLGLPDFYDTSEELVNEGMGAWSLMDYGCYNESGRTPSAYTAYEKEFLGWMEIETLDTEQTVILRPTADGGKAYRVLSNENTNEYFILENIQKRGWNRGAYGHGMLIIHVDYKESAWEENTVNNETPERMVVVPADNRRTRTSSGYAGDPWPGTSGNTELTDFSAPAFLTNAGMAVSKPITDIQEKDGIITFNFMKGCGESTTALNGTDVTAWSFNAQWQAGKDADEYVLEVFRIKGEHTHDIPWTTALLNESGELIRTIHTIATQQTVNNLEGDNLYCYRVRCISHGVLSICSNVVFVHTNAEDAELPIPVLNAPTTDADGNVSLSWNEIPDASYIVEYECRSYEPEVETPDGSLLFTEYFDKVRKSQGDISRVLDAYTVSPDWRGEEVHALDGEVLIGNDTKHGLLVSPYLPHEKGMVTVEFSVRKYDKNDVKPIFIIALATDANASKYVDQTGGYVEDTEYKNYYCVLGPLDTGSQVAFISYLEEGNTSAPRIVFDHLSIYWGDRSDEYKHAGAQAPQRLEALNGPALRRSEGAQTPARVISTSTRQYLETDSTGCILPALNDGCWMCRVRSVTAAGQSPFSDARTAVVGDARFKVNGLDYEIISTDRKAVQLVPSTDKTISPDGFKGYTGDIVIPGTVSYEGVEYTVTALADSVFRGCRGLTSVVVPSTVTYVGCQLFKGCKNLCWVDWQNEASVDATAFIGTSLNALLFVGAKTEVASKNVIVVRDGKADEMTLYLNFPFSTPREFTASKVMYQKDFSQKNSVGHASGWETLSVPFDVQAVMHEKKGNLTPFGSTEGSNHYWLGTWNGDCFVPAEAIRANVPYVIAFPNSDEYREDTRINGTITFLATDAVIHPLSPEDEIQGHTFNFMPTNRKLYASTAYLTLNTYDNADASAPAGSTFIADRMSIRGFGAVLKERNARTGEAVPPFALRFEEGGNEEEEEESTSDTNVWSLDGRRLSPDAALNGSSPRILIVNGKKILIR